MSVTDVQDGAGRPGTSAAVRVVDADVHPMPRPGELDEYLPEPYRSRFWRRQRKGQTILYDSPDDWRTKAMRMDAFPEDGGFPGSDPELAFTQLIMEAGSDIAILEPTVKMQYLPELTQSADTATNHWLAQNWLDGKGNWHDRWRGSICAAIDAPAEAAREIEYWAGHRHMVQVLIRTEQRPAWGDPQYDPVWEAASRHGLPVASHVARGSFEQMPMSPVGFSSYNHDFMTSYSLLAANQIMSLVFDGVFERFPELQIVFVEYAYSWILPLMWRMDAVYEARKGDIPSVRRKPSDYVREHIWFTTQPLDFPEDRREVGKLMEWMEADQLLLFSSDYPHWTFDDPRWIVRQIPEKLRAAIMYENGVNLYGLPASVPALDGQTRVW